MMILPGFPVIMGSGRWYGWWRINVLSGGSRCYFYEIEFRESGVNVSLGGTPFSSFGDPVRAFDGNTSTSTSSLSASYPAHVGYSLPLPINIQDVRIYGGDYTPTEFNIERSKDGIFWEVVRSVSTSPWPPGGEWRVFEA